MAMNENFRVSCFSMPDSVTQRMKILIQNSEPTINRPRVSEPIEALLLTTDRQAAVAYAACEDTAARLLHLANDLMNESIVRGKKEKPRHRDDEPTANFKTGILKPTE